MLLEPVSRSSPGADGVVDLYLLPAYDDIASIYYYNNHWNLHYMFDGAPTVGNLQDAAAIELTAENLLKVLSEMEQNAD